MLLKGTPTWSKCEKRLAGNTKPVTAIAKNRESQSNLVCKKSMLVKGTPT
jgi:hypothetical protein